METKLNLQAPQQQVEKSKNVLAEFLDKNFTTKEITINNEKYDRKELVDFCLKQAGLTSMSKVDIMYINRILEKKQLNPMEGQISFFKSSRTGRIQAIPKYTAQLDLLNDKLKKDADYLGRDYEAYEDAKFGLCGKATIYFKEPKKNQVYTLYNNDFGYKGPNAMLKLRKQTWLQLIREYYPELDLGYEEDELTSFNSGYKPEQVKAVEEQQRNIKVELINNENR